jgi:threonine dehydrogenase-like Zn-dependent dehydrogenase
MRASVITAPGQAEVTAAPNAEPGPDQVKVAIAGCGVCASSLPVWQGRPWFGYPLPPGAPGHEGWGEVVTFGDAVTGRRVGEQVAFLCDRAFADTAIVDDRDIVALPAALRDQVFPGEALGCAFNAAARSDFQAGQTVAVVGVGFLGAILTALAAAAGARVVAISRRPFSLEMARTMGATDTVLMDDEQKVIRAVRDLTHGAMCERVVEAVGAQRPLDLAGELTGVRGRLVIAGYHQDGLRTVNLQQWNWRGIDVVNAHERDRAIVCAGMAVAATAVASGQFDPTPLYTHRFPLDRLGSAFDGMASRPDGFLKALVIP